MSTRPGCGVWREVDRQGSVCTSTSYLRPEAPSGPAFMPPTPCLSALGVWQLSAKNISDSPHGLLPGHDRVTPTEPSTRHELRSSEESQKQPQPKTGLGLRLRTALPTSLPLSLAYPAPLTQSPSQVSTLTGASGTTHRKPQIHSRQLTAWAPRPGGPASSGGGALSWPQHYHSTKQFLPHFLVSSS